jgi:hypothetical protein
MATGDTVTYECRGLWVVFLITWVAHDNQFRWRTRQLQCEIAWREPPSPLLPQANVAINSLDLSRLYAPNIRW